MTEHKYLQGDLEARRLPVRGQRYDVARYDHFQFQWSAAAPCMESDETTLCRHAARERGFEEIYTLDNLRAELDACSEWLGVGKLSVQPGSKINVEGSLDLPVQDVSAKPDCLESLTPLTEDPDDDDLEDDELSVVGHSRRETEEYRLDHDEDPMDTLTHYYWIGDEDRSAPRGRRGDRASVAQESPSLSSPVSDLYSDASEAADWPEAYVTRIQTWFRKQSARGRLKAAACRSTEAAKALAGLAACRSNEASKAPDGLEGPASRIQRVFLEQAAWRGQGAAACNSKAASMAAVEPESSVTRIQQWVRMQAARRGPEVATSQCKKASQASVEFEESVAHIQKFREQAAWRTQEAAAWRSQEAAACRSNKASQAPVGPEVSATRIQKLFRGRGERRKEDAVACQSKEASGAPVGPEVSVTQMEAWFRKRGVRRHEEGVACLQTAAEPHLVRCSEDDVGLQVQAFQERVRVRAYFLYMGGSTDEKRNYYAALETELELLQAQSDTGKYQN